MLATEGFRPDGLIALVTGPIDTVRDRRHREHRMPADVDARGALVGVGKGRTADRLWRLTAFGALAAAAVLPMAVVMPQTCRTTLQRVDNGIGAVNDGRVTKRS